MPQSESPTEETFVNPLYAFITLLLGSMVALAAWPLMQAGKPLWAALIVGVGGGHIALYWLNRWLPTHRLRWLLYYTFQALLIAALAFLILPQGIGVSVVESAVICIIAEALGWWGNGRRALGIAVAFVALVVALNLSWGERSQFLPNLFMLLVNGGGIVLIMILFNQQTEARRDAEELMEQLESANAQLAASAAKIHSLTLQGERQRMARELHDTLAQGVAGLLLQLEAVKAHLAAERPERAASIVDQALGRARDTLADTRAAIDDLRAAPLDFEEELRTLVAAFSQQSALPCTLTLEQQGEGPPHALARQALAILREALSNVGRHAHASRAAVQVVVRPALLALSVCDDGIGFDSQQVAAGRYGLLGMHERARLVGGHLHIESVPQGGTTIRLTIGSAP